MHWNKLKISRCTQHAHKQAFASIITCIYTQTKKKRPIFMALYLSIWLRCCNKNKPKIFIKCPTHKKW